MKSWLVYITVIFSFTAASAMEFKDLNDGARYRLQGQIPVEVVCTIKDGSDTLSSTKTEWNLIPNTGTTSLGSSDYPVPVVDVAHKEIVAHGFYTEYFLTLNVPGLSVNEQGKECTATYSFKKQGVSQDATVTALATY